MNQFDPIPAQFKYLAIAVYEHAWSRVVIFEKNYLG